MKVEREPSPITSVIFEHGQEIEALQRIIDYFLSNVSISGAQGDYSFAMHWISELGKPNENEE